MTSYNYYWQQVCPSVYTPTVPHASLKPMSKPAGHGGQQARSVNETVSQQFEHTHTHFDLIGGAEAPTPCSTSNKQSSRSQGMSGCHEIVQSANACKPGTDIHLKVFPPTNKKRNKMFTLRSVPMDETDIPEKL